MDRLQEMKELLSKLYVLLKGDDFNLSLLTQLETSLNLIENEYIDKNKSNKILESRDHQLFEDVFSKTYVGMEQTAEQVYKLMQFVSLLQIKYSESEKKNIFNINNEIDKYNVEIKITEKGIDERNKT